MNSSRNVIVSLDETGRIQGANTRLHQYLGLAVADLVGEPIDVLLADVEGNDEFALFNWIFRHDIPTTRT